MQVLKTVGFIIVSLLVVGMVGCGGGGGSVVDTPKPPSTPVSATVVVGSVPAGKQLGSLKITITLPAGVFVKAKATGEVLDGVILPLGPAAAVSTMVIGRYDASTSKLQVTLVSPTTGFGNGDCLSVTLDNNGWTPFNAANIPVAVDEAKGFNDGTNVIGVAGTLK